MDLNEKKKNRFLFLKSLYEASNGDTGAMFDQHEVGAELKFPYDETRRIVEYLIGEHLLEARAMGGVIGLTHWGIKEVEQALENPDKPTEHFLPINIINIGSILENVTGNAMTPIIVEQITRLLS
jgi:hypothetical protein